MIPALSAQEIRNIDGYANNLQHPEWGSVEHPIVRVTSNGYSDGIDTPTGLNRPNPRHISNVLFAQSELINDPQGLSDFTWVFGQFIDHDITLFHDSEDPSDFYPIPVPAGDQHFDPHGTGEVIIPLMRNAHDPKTGTSPDNPRTPKNNISAFIDGSGIYGSDEYRAFWVRSLKDGKLKMTEDNLLPFNTVDGEMNAALDQDAPAMAMENPFATQWFIAGDVRANENTLLLSLHTLFAREHNRICDELLEAHPDWSDREIFQTAKRRVSGYIQAIVYEEWLPSLGVDLPNYERYNSSVNPGISNIFSGAAFRYGHTTINSNIVRMANDGTIMDQGNTLLKEIFFNPMTLMEAGGIAALLKGMSTQVQQEFDCKMVDDLRNFLFGPPGAGGLDLAAINIQRGRERGLADYNTVRQDMGLSLLNNFSELSNDNSLNREMEELYGDVNDIDPWVGMLAESNVAGSIFGETAMHIIAQQFQNLRDGDRFYYENDPMLNSEDIEEIKNTKLAYIIRRNFDIVIHDDVFIARPHEEEMTTSLPEIITDNTLNIAPNPASDKITLSFTSTEGGNSSITLYNPLGQVVNHQAFQVQTGDNYLPIVLPSAFTNGLYTVRLEFKHATIASKIIVKK